MQAIDLFSKAEMLGHWSYNGERTFLADIEITRVHVLQLATKYYF